MALPLVPLAVGLGIGAGAVALSELLSPAPTKEELKRDTLAGDTLFIVQPKTPLQRTATNIVNSLFF